MDDALDRLGYRTLFDLCYPNREPERGGGLVLGVEKDPHGDGPREWTLNSMKLVMQEGYVHITRSWVHRFLGWPQNSLVPIEVTLPGGEPYMLGVNDPHDRFSVAGGGVKVRIA